MKRFSLLAAAVLAGVTSLSAQAVVIDAKFSGTVASQANAGFTLNSPVTGEFLYDTASAKYLSFTVGGQTVAPGYMSTASMTPDMYSAIYQAQVSPLQTGGTFNSTFVLDLEALNTPWASGDAISLLGNGAALASNLDTANSSFRFYSANVDGTNIHSMTATLTGLQVSAVPEPASLALMLGGLSLVAVAKRRSRR